MGSNDFIEVDLELIRKQQGSKGMRSLFSLYIPAGADVTSVIIDLQTELDRNKRRVVSHDNQGLLITELLQELITLLDTSDFSGFEKGLAIFFGLNDKEEKLRWTVSPLPGSSVVDYLLVCDAIFYIDSCLEQMIS